ARTDRLRRYLGLRPDLGRQRQTPPLPHVDGAHGEPYAAARPRDTHHLRDRSVGIALLEHGDGEYAVEGLIGEWQCQGATRREPDSCAEFRCKVRGPTQKEAIDVHRIDARAWA